MKMHVLGVKVLKGVKDGNEWDMSSVLIQTKIETFQNAKVTVIGYLFGFRHSFGWYIASLRSAGFSLNSFKCLILCGWLGLFFLVSIRTQSSQTSPARIQYFASMPALYG